MFERLPVGRYHVTSPIDFFPGTPFLVSQGETSEQNITMTLLPVEAEFTVCAECPTIIVPKSLADDFAADAKDALDHPVSAPRPPGGWESYLPGMGAYPQEFREAMVDGTVVIEGRIGLDGVPTGFRVDSSSNLRVAKAAIDALSTEAWEPGRVRGTAIEVPFRFLIRYALSDR